MAKYLTGRCAACHRWTRVRVRQGSEYNGVVMDRHRVKVQSEGGRVVSGTCQGSGKVPGAIQVEEPGRVVYLKQTRNGSFKAVYAKVLERRAI